LIGLIALTRELLFTFVDATLERWAIMMSRRFAVVGLSALGVPCMSPVAWAQDVHMMQSTPAASAVIDGRSTEFIVRFDKTVDQIHSLLTITSGGKVVETLHPRVGAAQNVLFARASTLAPGDYKLHWMVKSIAGADVAQGDIPFTVKP
jgi:methionine-rich copper-binding protein CopC